MRVEATRQAASTHPDFTGGSDHERKDNEESFVQHSRALVVTDSASAAAGQTSPVYREAAFLAHPIATKAHAPQTRERRRVEPAEALAAYRTAIALTH